MSQYIVVKVGGVASQNLTDDFVNQIAKWQNEGNQVVIVHGGGYAINQLMEEHQIPVEKVDGLRVTSLEAMKWVTYGLTEIVGPSIKERLEGAGLTVKQLKEEIQDIFTADILSEEKYGYVGTVPSVDAEKLETIINNGNIPLIPSLAYSESGQELNINADYLATAVATSLKADKLILMTDVPGVKENDQVLASLSLEEIPKKIAEEVITGGMIPKVESAAETVNAGVKQVVIGSDLTSGTIIQKG